MENELRSDWAGDRKSLIAEVRWRRAKAWRSKGLEYARGRASELRVSRAAHDRLIEIWRSVRSVDAGVPQLARSGLGDSREWKKGTSSGVVAQIAEFYKNAGVVEGPMWIAVDRAAARACQRWRVRVEAYGWGRPILERDVVTTIRLPFGEHYGASPGRFTGTGWNDRTLLGEFEVIGAGDEPALCAYAECALLSTGWAIRFVAAGPAPERERGAESSPPPY